MHQKSAPSLTGPGSARHGIGWNLRTLLRLAGVSGLAIGLAATGGCDRGAAGAQGPPPRPPAPVVVADAVARDVPVYLDEIGRTTASEVVSIQAQASGRITEILFTDGAELTKGQPLFTIDPRPYQAALDQAKASLAQDQANLTLAKQEFERVRGLLDAKAVSKEDFEQRQNAVTVAESRLQGDQAAIETAQVNLDYCFIKSPINGRAGQRLVDLGNVVTDKSGTSLLTIQKLNPIYADFTINERDLARVRENMANHTLKVQVKLPSEPGDGREGDLTFLDNAVQNATGTIKLRATLANADAHFWPGQFVNVRLVLKVLKDAVLVPSAAPQIGQKGAYVFVIKANETAEQRPVTLGQRQGEMVVVESGMKAGEHVVIDGQMSVMPGGPVRILPSSPTTAPAHAPTTAPAPALEMMAADLLARAAAATTKPSDVTTHPSTQPANDPEPPHRAGSSSGDRR